MARDPYAGAVPWTATHVFWSDERCVPANDPRSNERMARWALLEQVPIPPDQVHPVMRGEPGMDPAGASAGQAGRAAERAAERYEHLLRARFPGAGGAGGSVAPAGLDLVLLGLGEDGHTASLFPQSAAASERQRWVAPSLPGDPATAGQGDNVWRVTLTVPFINLASLVVFLVQGIGKADVVRDVLEGTAGPSIKTPATLIHPASGRVLWLMDRDSASLLAGDEGFTPAAVRAGENNGSSGSSRGGAGCATPGEVG